MRSPGYTRDGSGHVAYSICTRGVCILTKPGSKAAGSVHACLAAQIGVKIQKGSKTAQRTVGRGVDGSNAASFATHPLISQRPALPISRFAISRLFTFFHAFFTFFHACLAAQIGAKPQKLSRKASGEFLWFDADWHRQTSMKTREKA